MDSSTGLSSPTSRSQSSAWRNRSARAGGNFVHYAVASIDAQAQ
jgi:hypothetical protein